ncbi:SDR family NAD(P)-dependent oxidoreductase [Streptomyces sp. NPDC054864]
MSKLSDRAAIVTGSGRGIGRSIALKLAAEGARVVVNDLDAGPAEETVAEIKAAGGQAVACPGSVSEEGFAERVVDVCTESFGGLDIIVNNAGYTWDNVVQKMTDEQWDAVLDVHLKAPFRLLRAAQPYLKAHPVAHHRKVVNISSIAGLGGNAGQVNYSAAKAGVVGLTKTMSKEWGRYQVNVNAVAFGLIETRLTSGAGEIEVEGREIKVGVNPDLLAAMARMIPLGRGGTPEEAAGAVYLLCLPESDYVSGQVLVCGGGYE